MFECSFDWNVHLSMSDSSRRRAELMCCARSRRVVLRVPDHFNGIALFMTRKHLYLAIIVATISQLTKTVTNFGSSWTGLSFTLRSARNILMSPHTHTHTVVALARGHTRTDVRITSNMVRRRAKRVTTTTTAPAISRREFMMYTI